MTDISPEDESLLHSTRMQMFVEEHLAVTLYPWQRRMFDMAAVQRARRGEE